MPDIKKIKHLKVSSTPEKVTNDWNEIKSLRNRLLQNSDWIFAPDNNLTEEIIDLWIQWRKTVRLVNQFTDIKEALNYINDLQNNIPPTHSKDNPHSSVESYKAELLKQLLKIVAKVTEPSYVTCSREIMLERFDEAVRFFDGKTDNNFLIKLEAIHTNLSENEIAEKFLNDRKAYLIKLITIEKVKNKFIKRIEAAITIEDCDTLNHDLLILNIKKWV